MTPAIKTVEKAKIAFTVHEYEHDPDADSYGLEAAAALGIDEARVFKTLLVSLQGGTAPLAVGVISRLASTTASTEVNTGSGALRTCSKNSSYGISLPGLNAARRWSSRSGVVT